MKKAFTLAEVLITLVIIGIVAAITVPTLNNSYTDRMYISALKKNYSVLSNAFNLSKKYDYNDFTEWKHADGDTAAIYQNYIYLKKYLNILRECKNKPGCWSKERTQAPNGRPAANTNANGIGGNIVTFTLTDGTNVCLDYWNENSAKTLYGVATDLDPHPLIIFVDVNGDKKPNRFGKDVFTFVLTKKGLKPAGTSNKSVHCKTTGVDCAAKYIRY